MRHLNRLYSVVHIDEELPEMMCVCVVSTVYSCRELPVSPLPLYSTNTPKRAMIMMYVFYQYYCLFSWNRDARERPVTHSPSRDGIGGVEGEE